MSQFKCACRSENAYRCWEERYSPRDWDVGEVDMDGGPCECECHDGEDDDEMALFGLADSVPDHDNEIYD